MVSGVMKKPAYPAMRQGVASRWWLAAPLLLLSAGAANIPLFGFNALFCSEDLNAYYRWTGQFTQAVMEGVGRPRWDASGTEGLGSPAFLYVSPLFFYAAALFRMLGAEVWLAMRLVVFAVLWLSGLSVWFGLRRVIPPRWALPGAIIFQFNPFLFHALNLHNLFPFYCATLPLTWLFFATVLPARTGRIVPVAVSLAALVLTHQLVAFMALLSFPFIFLPGLIRGTGEAWGRAITWGAGCALGLGMAAYYLYPAMTTQSLIVTDDWFEPFFIDWRNSFIVPVITWYRYGIRWMGVQWILGGLAVFSLLVLLMGARALPRSGPAGQALVRGGMWAGGAAIFLASEWAFGLWALFPFLQMIHWPYRFLLLILPLMAIALTALAGQTTTRTVKRLAVIALLLYPALQGALQVKSMAVSMPPDFPRLKTQHYLRVAVPGEEWKAFMEQGGFAGECAAAGATLVETRMTTHDPAWIVQADRAGRLRLPVFAFPAWRVEINGHPVAAETDQASGLLTVSVGSGIQEVRIFWRRMPEERTGLFISLAAMLITGLIGVHAWRHRMADDGPIRA